MSAVIGTLLTSLATLIVLSITKFLESRNEEKRDLERQKRSTKLNDIAETVDNVALKVDGVDVKVDGRLTAALTEIADLKKQMKWMIDQSKKQNGEH
jgi:membrane protein implicated in regulation of membrane protease activity